jgi:hypothetical protein
MDILYIFGCLIPGNVENVHTVYQKIYRQHRESGRRRRT